MKHLFLFVSIISVLSACNLSDNASANNNRDTNSADNADGDWVSLFDGKTFAGWHTYGKNGIGSAWKVEDSTIHLNALQKKGWQTANGGDLVTDEEYSNFDLKLEWKISKAGNSGIFFYVHEDTTKFNNPNQSGLEMQINDDENNKNGKSEKQKAGDLVNLIAASASAKAVKPAGQWNEAEIKADRGQLDFFINDQHILSVVLWNVNWQQLIDDSKFKKYDNYGNYKKGRIALQDHGEDVWFRNIRIKKL